MHCKADVEYLTIRAFKIFKSDLILENRSCTHIPGFREIQI